MRTIIEVACGSTESRVLIDSEVIKLVSVRVTSYVVVACGSMESSVLTDTVGIKAVSVRVISYVVVEAGSVLVNVTETVEARCVVVITIGLPCSVVVSRIVDAG